ncbi:hypothetical protein F5887DRAFT_232486 [Amanita rubescens]|nr:hypothetical protein F5887DRAFT_232486 [Amanita rubescens]
MSFITIKLKKAKAPTRLAYFDVQPSWEDLASKIIELYKVSPENVSVTFFDEAKDTVTITSEEELQHFYKRYYQSSEEIKFVVQDDPALTSTWSADSNLSGLSGSSNDRLQLNCWVLTVSDNPSFVDVGKSMTVDKLKEVIKEKKKEHPPIPSTEIDTKLKGVQRPQQIPGRVKLNPLDELSEHFPSPLRKHLHIIVEAPPTPLLIMNVNMIIRGLHAKKLQCLEPLQVHT